MIDLIKETASIITALSVIIGALTTINRLTRGKILSCLQKPVLDKLNEHDKRLDDLEVNDLKQIIMNDNIPLSERINAGKRYLELGGNGEIHARYDVLVEEYKKELGGKQI